MASLEHIVALVIHTIWAFVAIRILSEIMPVIREKKVNVKKRSLEVDVQ